MQTISLDIKNIYTYMQNTKNIIRFLSIENSPPPFIKSFDNPKFKKLVMQYNFFNTLSQERFTKMRKENKTNSSKLCNISRVEIKLFSNSVSSEISFRVRSSCQLITGRKEKFRPRGYYISWHPHSTRLRKKKIIQNSTTPCINHIPRSSEYI